MESEWLEAQRRNLIEFGKLGFDPQQQGFGRLQADGSVLLSSGIETWANCRAVYCFTLDVLAGEQSSGEWAEKGARALLGRLWDDECGGWFTGVDPAGHPHNDGRKEAYTHAFVLLAASSLSAIGSGFASEIFARIDNLLDTWFWAEDERATQESWNRDWSRSEAYRGANSNMHLTEASLAAFDVTGDTKWLHRARDIVERVIHREARACDWRIPEHFTERWEVIDDYNIDQPDHPFRPYGSTPGHGFEWARLILQLSAGLRREGIDVPAWHLEASRGLFDRAVEDGWARDGEPGFCYTVDFSGRVVNSLHLAWVACEALSTSLVLEKVTRDSMYSTWSTLLWEYCSSYLVDNEFGGWKTELDSRNRPSSVVWGDKPDFYHPLQTVLIPRLPVGPSLLGAFAKE